LPLSEATAGDAAVEWRSMREYATILEEALEAWEFTREGVIDEFQALPEKDLGYKPAEKSRSVIELVQHIVESGTLMVGELTRSDGDFQRKSYEGFLHEYGRGISAKRTKAQLLDALKKTHTEGQRRFREVGELHMLQFIRRFDGKTGTRFAWMNHGISHEEYHRGQLALYTRLLGRVPALTRRIEGK
jgi:uncharacterized damage-inducible protein DinB